ncbi:MAG: hypothetical protein JSR48_10635 [Verrucomicrobia bacterium]|nr:hypothetical protein [Verrucomicrobiota bacterium]
MKRESLLVGLFLGVALTVTVVLLSRQEPVGPGRALRSAPLPSPTPEEERAREDYLASYARRKFAPWLARLRVGTPGDLADRAAVIVAERERRLAGAREASRKCGMAMEAYCERVTAEARAALVAAGGDNLGRQFDDFLTLLPERLVVGNVNQVLVYRGDAMTADQMERVCVILHQSLPAPPVGRPSVAVWDAYLDRIRGSNEAVLAATASWLAPVQVQALREELELQWLHLRSQRRDIRIGQELSRS